MQLAKRSRATLSAADDGRLVASPFDGCGPPKLAVGSDAVMVGRHQRRRAASAKIGIDREQAKP